MYGFWAAQYGGNYDKLGKQTNMVRLSYLETKKNLFIGDFESVQEYVDFYIYEF